jgi:hypothetical protein
MNVEDYATLFLGVGERNSVSCKTASLPSEFRVVMSVTISDTNDVRFVFVCICLQEGSCLIYVICDCLRIVVSKTYCETKCDL